MSKPNFGERLVYLFSPKQGQALYSKRANEEAEKNRGMPGSGRTNAPQMATGYANHGASTTLNSMIGWIVGGGAA